MPLELLGLGTAVPTHFLSQSDAAAVATQLAQPSGNGRVANLYQRAGVQQRHCVLLEHSSPHDMAGTGDMSAEHALHILDHQELYRLPLHEGDRGPTTAERMAAYGHHAPILAFQAARLAVNKAAVDTSEITDLITVSCTGFTAPGFDVTLIEQLGLPRSTTRTHLGFMGCHGMMNGLRVASAFATANPRATVLVCAVELCSLHQQYTQRVDRVIANSLFADGAAAVVARHAPEPAANGSCVVDSGSYIFPDSRDAMAWEIGDHGFEMGLARRIPDLIREHGGAWLHRWLGDHGLTPAMVGGWAIHPGGPKIVEAVGESLGLSQADLAPSLDVLAKYGNMSSPTVLFVLEELHRRGADSPLVLLGFGPGLTIEAAILD